MDEFDLHAYPMKFLLCRLRGDVYPPPEEWHWKRLVNARGRVLKLSHAMMCARCGKIMLEEMDPVTGETVRKPRYPEGYRVPGGLPRSLVRLEVLRRMTAERQPGTFEDELVAG